MLEKGTVYILTGGLNEDIGVVCGSPHAAETTSMNISTTTTLSTTRLSSQSSVILSTEPTTAMIIRNANITTNTTAAILSGGRICGHQIDLKCKYAQFLTGSR